MQEIAEKSLGDLVQEDHPWATIFENHKLDFCCGGKKTLQKACEESEIDLQSITRLYAEIDQVPGGLINVRYLPLDNLCDYIERKHHKYVLENSPIIMAYVQKVYSVHGSRHPELSEVLSLFGQVTSELSSHMEKEEKVLFPLIRKIAEARRNNAEKPDLIPTLSSPIRQMMSEHEVVGDLLKRISAVTHNYTPPADACNTYRVMLAKLDEFEKDLHVHVHLENNVLFPGVQKMEEV